MSSLFAQINQLNQEAQQQRSLAKQGSAASPTAGESSTLSTIAIEEVTDKETQRRDTNTVLTDNQDVVAPRSGTTVPHSGTTTGAATMNEQATTSPRRATRTSAQSENLGKGSRLDIDKLRTIIEELSDMEASANGLNVRMSAQERRDIEDFRLDTLRKVGIEGQEVSTAKLMRYAMRYMFRVHPQEFVTALRAALEVEETLSI